MEGRHRARSDPAEKAVAHDQLVALAKLLDEGHQIAEVVAIVGVAHDHVATARGLDTAL